MIRTLSFLCLVSAASAWTTPTMSMGGASSSVGRRQVLNTITAAGAVVFASPIVANAIEACPPKSNNCVRATWTPPAGTSKKDAITSLKAVLNAYPQEGQDNVDGGGWALVQDDLDSKGTARVEYKSSGKGNFAKFLNGGKPFTDDLLIEVSDSGTVELRSSSRVGESDFGVNAKV